jgi:hypothetical protein
MSVAAAIQNSTFIKDTPYYVTYDFTKLDHFDSWMYAVISFVGMFTSLFLFLGHIFGPKLRKPPGDLVMMISLAEFLLSVHWFSSGIKTQFFTTYDKDPHDRPAPQDNYSDVRLTSEGYMMKAVG